MHITPHYSVVLIWFHAYIFIYALMDVHETIRPYCQNGFMLIFAAITPNGWVLSPWTFVEKEKLSDDAVIV